MRRKKRVFPILCFTFTGTCRGSRIEAVAYRELEEGLPFETCVASMVKRAMYDLGQWAIDLHWGFTMHVAATELVTMDNVAQAKRMKDSVTVAHESMTWFTWKEIQEETNNG